MNSVKCLCCDGVFDIDDMITQDGSAIDSDTNQINLHNLICPQCNHTDFIEVEQCSYCDTYVVEGELDADKLCKDCSGEKEVEVEFCISVSITYKGKFPYKAIRDYHNEDEDNPLATKEIHEEVRNQVAAGNYCITNYTWEEI